MHSQTNTQTLEMIVSRKAKNNAEHKKEELRCTRAARVAHGWWLDAVVAFVLFQWCAGEVTCGWWFDAVVAFVLFQWCAGEVTCGWWLDAVVAFVLFQWCAGEVTCGWWSDAVVAFVHSGVLTKRRAIFTLASLLCAIRRQ
jgi:hypothetical protein